ncbi:MAG: glycosyltransferase family 39 protein [Dehalococcoidia bacterium]|nr:glycosyltransferase family 39 protein [Dehalococcoidia bacterium]
MDWLGLRARFRTLSPRLLLPLILAVALGLRFYGIGWDQGYGFHPDERSFYMRADCMYRVLTEAPGYADCTRDYPEMEPGLPSIGTFFDAAKSPLNPHWFSLGSVLIYLLVALRFVLEPFTDLNTLQSMGYLGRSIMALADVGTVFIVYLLGKRIYDRRVGLLAAALVALAVVHIQNSHFYRPEPLLVLFLMASFWAMLQVMEQRRLRDSLLLGACVGLTLAAKVSVLPLVLPLLAVYGFSLFTTAGGAWGMPSREQLYRVGAHALAAGAMSAAVFFITTPYALLDVRDFVGDLMWEATNVARTAGKVPFTVQYVGSTPFLYELRQTSVWGLGLPLGVAAWGGLLFTTALAVFKLAKKAAPPRGQLLFLAWVIPNFLMLGIFELKFLRYILPLIPFLILMGAGMLFGMLDWTRSPQFQRAISYPALWPFVKLRATLVPSARDQGARTLLTRYAPHAVIGVIAFVVAATAFYAIAFERVYARSHPAIQASDWINENAPRNSVIVTDNHWDEGIPNIYDYQVRQIPIYEGDTYGKMDTIADHLSGGDYLIFYSNRTYGSVARLPERYPLSSRYYKLLFSGELGYRLERAFTSYPELLGVAFVDDTFTRAQLPAPESLKSFSPAPVSLNLGYADENVINYDHPKVLLFRNEDGLSKSRLYAILTSGASETPPLGLMLSPEQKAAQREGGTSEIDAPTTFPFRRGSCWLS